jgi:hypothetical protein
MAKHHSRRPSAVLLLLLAISAAGAADRSRTARAEFMRTNPCPATGKTSGACPGYQVDHVRALCAGGVDHRSNMAWLTVEQHKAKTRDDVGRCRAQRAGFLDR